MQAQGRGTTNPIKLENAKVGEHANTKIIGF